MVRVQTIVHKKATPKIGLNDILRRRKTTLKQLMSNFGITTYAGLEAHCHRIGVLPPDEESVASEFPSPPVVNNPSEGVIVLDELPSTYVVEATGEVVDQPAIETTDEGQPDQPTKKQRKKKDQNTVT